MCITQTCLSSPLSQHKAIKRRIGTRSCSGSKPAVSVEKTRRKTRRTPRHFSSTPRSSLRSWSGFPRANRRQSCPRTHPHRRTRTLSLQSCALDKKSIWRCMLSRASAKTTPSSVPSVCTSLICTTRPADLPLAATASYRLLPKIILNPAKPVPSELAEKFQKSFSSGVIRVHPHTKKVSVDDKSARFESMSREVYRHPEFEGCVQLARVRDHFLCASCFVTSSVSHLGFVQSASNQRASTLQNVSYPKRFR